MKSKLILIIIALFLQMQIFAQSADSDDFIKDSDLISLGNKWYEPDYSTFQFAGNIGLLSVGLGFELFKQHLNTELIYGFVPVYDDRKAIHQFTLKNFMPIYHFKFKPFTISPYAGFTASYETGRHSDFKLPERYSEGYYRSNTFHFTVFAGAKLHRTFKKGSLFSAADFYVELGALDSPLWYAIDSKEVTMSEVFSTAIGLNFYF